MPYHTVSCRIMPYHAVSYLIMSCHAVSCLIIPYHVVSCPIMPCLGVPRFALVWETEQLRALGGALGRAVRAKAVQEGSKLAISAWVSAGAGVWQGREGEGG